MAALKPTRNNRTRWLALVAAAVLLVVAGALPRPSRTESLQLALGLWPGVETLIVAREKGLLPKERVQLIAMAWPSAAMRAFGNGAVDAAVLTLDEVLRLRESGTDLRVVMIMDASTGGDVILSDADVRNLADLRKKRVGVDLRASGMVLLESALQSAGMSANDVDVVPLNPSEVAAAMKEKRVDAVAVAEPWATRLRRAGGHAIFDSRQLKHPMYRVLVASGNAVRSQSAELQMVMTAHLATAEVLISSIEDSARAVVLRREGLNQQEFEECMTRVKIIDRDTGSRLMKPNGELEALSVAMEAWMLDAGLLEQQIPNSAWLDRSLLEGVR
ncbi:MAG: ABC transporter substrate-binding protein [Prosthecobacter sp.]